MKKSTKFCALLMVLFSTLTTAAISGCSDEAEGSSSTQTIVDERTVSLNHTTLNVTRGQYGTLEASLSYGEGIFTWTSSDPNVVTVDEYGRVYGVQVGTATVTATCGDKSASCTVTVSLPAYSPVFQTENQSYTVGIEATYPIDSTVLYNGEITTEAKITYTVADPTIASVDENGVITGLKSGGTTVNVKADYYGKLAEMTVNVTVTNTKVGLQANLAKAALETITDEENGFKQDEVLRLGVTYDGADISDTLTFAWSVADEGIVSLENSTTNSATVTATAVGATKVTVSFTYEGETFTYTFDVSVSLATHYLDKATAEDWAGDIRLTVPTLNAEEAPVKVFFGDEEMTVKEALGNEITLEAAAYDYGTAKIRIEYGEYCYEIANGLLCSKVITAVDKDNFEAILNGKPNGYFLLKEDINFAGEETKDLIDEFAGVLDGQGHVIKNVVMAKKHVNKAETDYPSTWFDNNKGTIKNIGLEYILPAGDTSWYVAPVSKNNGTIENVYVKGTLQVGRTTGAIGPIVGENWGTIKNAVVIVEKDGDIATTALGNVVGTDRGGTVSNVYTVHNGLVQGDNLNRTWVEQYPTGKEENCANFANFAEFAASVKALPAENGWNEAWGIHASGLPTFSGAVLGAMTLEPVTVSLHEGNYPIDLSAVSADILSVTLDGVAVTEKLSGKTLTLGKAELAGGEHALVVATEEVTYLMTVICNAQIITLDAQEVVAKDGVVSVDITGTTGEIAKVLIGDKDVTAYIGAGKVDVPVADMIYGESVVSIVTTGETDYEIPLTAYAGRLTQANAGTAADFKALLNAAPHGYFVLDGDIDFGGDNLVGAIQFTGVFDGRGHILKNFNINFNAGSDNGYNSYLFETNAGTIKNLGVEFGITAVNNNKGALIGTNSGVIENVYAKVSVSATRDNWAWYNIAPLADVNTAEGTIKNTIALLSIDGSNIPVASLGTLVIKERNGKILNSYAIHDGITLAEDNAGYMHVKEQSFNSGTYTGSKNYASGAALVEEVGTLSAENGWNTELWEIKDGAVLFAGKYITAIALEPVTVALQEGNYPVDLSAVPADILSVSMDGVDVSDKLSGKTLTFGKAELAGGEHKLVVYTAQVNYTMTLTCNAKTVTLDAQDLTAVGGNITVDLSGVTEGNIVKALIGETDYIANLNGSSLTLDAKAIGGDGSYTLNIVTDGETDYVLTINVTVPIVKIGLNMTNAGTAASLKAMLSETPDGYFVLEEDLDLGGDILVGAIDFAGSLDGQGYRIKNFNINFNAGSDNGYNSYIFNSNSGTIKNIGFVYSMTALNNNKGAIINTNAGTVENVYVDCTLAWSITSVWYQVGALTHTNNGTIKNVVVKVDLAEGVTVVDNSGTLTMGVITSYNSGSGIMENCYAINDDGLSYAMYPWATQTNVNVVTNASAITALPEGEGWNAELWEVKEGAVYFNGVILEKVTVALPATTVTPIAGKYTVDLSAVTEEILLVTVDGADVTEKVTGKTLSLAKGDLLNGDHDIVVGTAKGEYTLKVTAETSVTTLADATAEVVDGNFVITLTGVSGNATKVVVGDVDCTESYASGVITLPTATFANGTYKITVVTDGATDYECNVALLNGIIVNKTNAATLADFIALLNATPNGEFVLTEDLDFGGEISGAVVKAFTGTFDGAGHTISNFEIKFGLNAAGNDYISVLFEKNGGTIKNLGVDYTLGTANNSNVGLIMQNDGTVENLFVTVSFKAYQWTTGAIAAINGGTGTVKNCITVLNTTLADQAAKNRLGSIVGVDYNGTIQNCYSVVNGIHALEKPYVDTWNNGIYKDNANYATVAALTAAVTSLSSENGWNTSLWEVKENMVYFAGAAIDGTTSTPDPDPDPEVKPELEALPKDAIMLSSANAGTVAELKALLSETPNGYFALSEDLDLAGGSFVSGIDFAGTLDGRGYVIKNFNINFNAGSDNGYNSYVFKSNSGTIKNIGFVFNFVATNNNYAGLVYANSGTMENIYVDATFASTYVDAGGGTYTNLGILSFQQSVVGTFKNIVINIHSNAASIPAQSFGAISYLNVAGSTVENVHVIAGGVTASCGAPSISPYNWGGIALTGCATHAAASEITSLPESEGWKAAIWGVEGGLTFGSTKIS